VNPGGAEGKYLGIIAGLAQQEAFTKLQNAVELILEDLMEGC
jgi:hypothetical protein